MCHSRQPHRWIYNNLGLENVSEPLSITSVSTPATSLNSCAFYSSDRDAAPGPFLTVMVSAENSQELPGEDDLWLSSAIIALEDFWRTFGPGLERDNLSDILRQLRRNYERIMQDELTEFGQDIFWYEMDPPSPVYP